jgi:hypothetical protein
MQQDMMFSDGYQLFRRTLRRQLVLVRIIGLQRQPLEHEHVRYSQSSYSMLEIKPVELIEVSLHRLFIPMLDTSLDEHPET